MSASILHTSPEDLSRAAKTVNEKTRLGIPLIIGDDCIHGYSFWPGATISPSQLGMACELGPGHGQAAGRATAEEVSSTGVHWTFSPVLCIAPRHPLGSRGRDLRRGPHADRRDGLRHGQGLSGRAPRPARRCRRTRSSPAPSTSPDTPRPRAAVTPPKRTWPTASLNPAPAAVRTHRQGGLRHVHARLRVHRRRTGHVQQVAAHRQAARRMASTTAR